jgi:hypothetical protein
VGAEISDNEMSRSLRYHWNQKVLEKGRGCRATPWWIQTRRQSPAQSSLEDRLERE